MSKWWAIVILLLTVGCYLKREAIYPRLVVPDLVEWKRPSQKTPPLYGDRAIRQYFIPNFNGLFRIGFSIDYQEPSGAEIEVSVREKGTDRELFKEISHLEQFVRKKMRRFSFSPQWDSAGKIYYLDISAPLARPETGLRLLFDPGPFFHIATKGKLFYGEKELAGELSMVSECRVRVRKSEFLSCWRHFLADRTFAAFYIGTVALGLMLLWGKT